MKKLLLATNNQGKIKEIKNILIDLPFKILTLKDVKIRDLSEESGNSFQENALSKAKEVGNKSGILTLADDSGLEIEALGGRPGIHSARYVSGSDMDRINKVLSEMKGVPPGKRKARFISVIALYDPLNKKEFVAKGQATGKITLAPIGTNGFGYDPIFLSDDLKKTFGQASDKEKSEISHRARGLYKMLDILASFC